MSQTGPAGTLRALPGRLLRGGFLWASQQRSLERLTTAIPFTRALVERFVAGQTLAEALPVLEGLHAAGMGTTVDVLGESVDSEELALAAADGYVETLDALAKRGLDLNVSLKLTQMGLDVDPAFCLRNVGRVVERAAALDAFVRVDMEDHTRTDATLAIARELHGRYPAVGVVIQSYLRRSAADVEQLISERIRVRLCKGAYDEPASVAFASKAEVDESYRQLMVRLMREGVYPAIATHDEALLGEAVTLARSEEIAADRFEFQMLYGVRRDLQRSLVRDGWRVRVYVPFGAQWYPYFMRRLAERPANILFILRSLVREGRSAD